MPFNVLRVPLSYSQYGLAYKYSVEDVPGAMIPASRLRPILEKLEIGQAVSPQALAFLSSRGLHALHSFATGSIDGAEFHRRAAVERAERLLANERQDQADEESRLAREAVTDRRNAECFARNNDRRHRSQSNAHSRMFEKYGIGSINADQYQQVLRLVRMVDTGQRLSVEDVVWLNTHTQHVWAPELRKAYHKLEAMAFTVEWERTGNPQSAISASSEWRKACEPHEALKVTKAALQTKKLPSRKRSSLCTTRGGAMRDLGRHDDALSLGEEAHDLWPDSFHPCTLLGAIHIELGQFSSGKDWYDKAEQRGYESQSVDQDLKRIVARSTDEAGRKIRAYLFSVDPIRYAWATPKKAQAAHQ